MFFEQLTPGQSSTMTANDKAADVLINRVSSAILRAVLMKKGYTVLGLRGEIRDMLDYVVTCGKVTR